MATLRFMSDTLSTANLAAIVKAYDIRGLVGSQIDEAFAHRLGGAIVVALGERRVVVGHDMRPSSPELTAAFAEGASRAGADVTEIGLCSTDGLYFASGHLDSAGVMFTASHNPAEYNGAKLCRPAARPIGLDTGLAQIRDTMAAGPVPDAGTAGSIGRLELLDAYVDHLLALAPVTGRPLRVVADAGNGMAGLTAPAVFARLPSVEAVLLYPELDGTFPNHEANPIDPATLVDLQQRVVAEGADVGLAFDGDADRCFLVDERGELVSPSTLTARIARRELAKEPGATVIHNLITSRSVPEIVRELGGTPVRTRVGHSFIKAEMARTDAIFGGEHSGHFYFRDFWRADSGMLAALHALAALAEVDVPLSELLAEDERYVLSGEINSTVADPQQVLARIEADHGSAAAVEVDHLDGLTLTHQDWSANIRPSNTEPLLRLNVEGRDRGTMEQIRDTMLDQIRSQA